MVAFTAALMHPAVLHFPSIRPTSSQAGHGFPSNRRPPSAARLRRGRLYRSTISIVVSTAVCRPWIDVLVVPEGGGSIHAARKEST